MSARQLIELMRLEGSRLAKPVDVAGMAPMTFNCVFAEEGASSSEIALLGVECPKDLTDFWTVARWGKLFVDERYGQWGLEILIPEGAVMATESYRSRRKTQCAPGDVIVGKFLGDSDLLLIRCDSLSPDFGNVIVVPPLDSRGEWYSVAESLVAFLQEFVNSGGDKYWVRRT